MFTASKTSTKSESFFLSINADLWSCFSEAERAATFLGRRVTYIVGSGMNYRYEGFNLQKK